MADFLTGSTISSYIAGGLSLYSCYHIMRLVLDGHPAHGKVRRGEAACTRFDRINRTSTLALVEAVLNSSMFRFLSRAAMAICWRAGARRPRIVGIADAESPASRGACRTGIEIVHGEAACAELARIPADVAVAGIVGWPVDIGSDGGQAGQTVALANKNHRPRASL